MPIYFGYLHISLWGIHMKIRNYLLSFLLLLPFAVIAQESSEENVEEVVVVGSQIKGASITGALPVTVISSRGY